MLAGNELATPEASDGPTTYQAVNGSVNVDSIRRMGEYAVINAVYTAKLRLISHAILSRVHPTILPQHINSFSAVLSPIGGHMLAGMPSKYAAGFKSKTVFEVR